jgi:Xaa-Pro aminopeptidase
MMKMDCHLNLASQTRAKFFEEAGDGIDIVLSSNAQNRGYLSGYFSMSYNLNAGYQSAVVARREWAALVVSAADAGPALEAIENKDLVFRYGFFCFESEPGKGPGGYDLPGAKKYDDAVKDALTSLITTNDVIGVDRSNGDMLWDLVSKLLPGQKIVDVTETFATSRRTKLAGEIDLITSATKLVEAGLLDVFSQAKIGMSEQDLAAIISYQMAKGGGTPRFVSVTSGPRSALADSFATPRKLKLGDLVRIDAGCAVGGYGSDMARTFVLGKPSEVQLQRYQAIKAGIEFELKSLRAGVSTKKLFEDTVEVVRQNGIPSYRRQHVGHGIGLNGGYDIPIINSISDFTLLEGMTLCVETPYYVLGWGGMMIEDTILVTQTGYEPITTISRDLVQIG